MIEIPISRKDDLYNLEYADKADLILFMAGNQFMVMGELVSAFKSAYPEINCIFYETLPPGLELRQILEGGAIFQGKRITGRPDVYASVSEVAMKKLEEAGLIEKGDYFIYLHNRIVLMVPEGNPAGIKSIEDLARDDVRISQPNPQTEDITQYIVSMYKETGGERLVNRIMEQKRAEGTTIFTLVHHRETPIRLRRGTVDVGPVWATEVINAQRQGMELEMIEPGERLDQREKVNYFITKLKDAPNPKNALKFLDFIKSKRVQEIYKKFGFIPHFF